MKDLDPGRDDAGVRLRRRLRRGMPLAVLAGQCGVSGSFLSMVENVHRELRRPAHIAALAQALGACPLYLAYGVQAGPGGPPPGTAPAGSRRGPTAPPWAVTGGWPPNLPSWWPVATDARPGTGCAAWPVIRA